MNLKNKMIILLFLSLSFFLYIPFTSSSEKILTEDQAKWLEENYPVIRVAPDLNYAPIEFYTGQEFKGYSMDLLNYIEEHYPVTFELVYYERWSDAIDASKSGEIHLLPAVAKTRERDVFLNFTQPYISVNRVIVRRNDSSAIASEKDFLKRSVGVLEGYAVAEYLGIRYPDLELYTFESPEILLQKVSTGEIEAAVLEIAQASYFISEMRLTQLVIENRFQIDYPIDLGMGFAKDTGDLALIFDLILKNIPSEDYLMLQDNWFRLSYEQGLSPQLKRLIVLSVSFVLVTFFIVFFWNLLLRRKVHQKTKDLMELNEQLDLKVKERTEALEKSMSELRESQIKIIEMEKITALGQLVNHLFHEINTPLGNSLMTASLIEEIVFRVDYSSFEGDLEKEIKKLQKSSSHLIESIKKTIAISSKFKSLVIKNLETQKEAFLLNEMIEESFNFHMVNKPVQLMINSEKAYSILGYKRAYKSLFDELFKNAFLHAFNEEREDYYIKISIFKEVNVLKVRYEDNGRGLGPDEIRKIQAKVFDSMDFGGLGFTVIKSIVHHTFKGDLYYDPTGQQGLGLTLVLRDVVISEE